MKSVIVVPTCRPESFGKFKEAWRGLAGDDWIVIQDGEQASIPGALDWTSIASHLGADQMIISRRDSAIRSFGFYLAWKQGYDLIVTLDDDCYPDPTEEGVELSMGHLRAMLAPRFVSTIDGVRVRGLPYGQVGDFASHVNIGLWSGVLDLDAVNQLATPHPPAHELRAGSLRPGQFAPMCGMNLAFTREVAPLMYFGLQGHGQPVGRFDDIWCGVLAKRICDHLGLAWTYGPPIVHHSKASNSFSNLVKEAPGIAEHETYWRHLAKTPLTERTPAGCMGEAAAHIARYEPVYLPKDYFTKLGTATETWAKLFDP